MQRALALAYEVEKLASRGLGAVTDFRDAIAVIEDWMKVGSKKQLLQLRGTVEAGPIEQLLATSLDFNALKRSLIVTATNLTYGTSEAFYAFVGQDCNAYQTSFTGAYGRVAHQLSAVDLKDAVRASAAIPGFFEPVSMNFGTAGQKDFVDGGVANNTPVALAAIAGATEILVIMLQPSQALGTIFPTKTLAEIAMASYTVMQQQLLELDAQIVARDCGVKVQTVRPETPLQLSVLGFNDQPGIDAAFEQGARAIQSIQ